MSKKLFGMIAVNTRTGEFEECNVKRAVELTGISMSEQRRSFNQNNARRIQNGEWTLEIWERGRYEQLASNKAK